MPTGPRKVLSLSFDPSGLRILQTGASHFHLWTLSGRTISGKKGIFGASFKKQNLTCGGWLPPNEEGKSDGVVGAADGSVQIGRASCRERV